MKSIVIQEGEENCTNSDEEIVTEDVISPRHEYALDQYNIDNSERGSASQKPYISFKNSVFGSVGSMAQLKVG